MAAKKVHKHVGEMDCVSCSKPVPVKESDTGKLIAVCKWCDFENYATKGTIHHKNMMARTRLAPQDPPALPAPPAKPAAAAPAAAAASSGLPSWMGGKPKAA
jgi:hypothetical protein